MNHFFSISLAGIMMLCNTFVFAQSTGVAFNNKPMSPHSNGVQKPNTNSSLMTKAILFSEDFESGALPSGWTNTYGAATYGWSFSTDLSSSFFTIPAHTTYAGVNDDACNCDMSDVNLTTSAVDLSSGNAQLKFDYDFYYYVASSAEIQISVDGGTTFTLVESLPVTDDWCENYIVDLSSYTSSSALIRFHYNDGGGWEYGFTIDNVSLFTLEQNDLRVTSISPLQQIGGSNYTPIVTVNNFGLSTQTAFDVNVTIHQGATEVYNQTMSLTGQSLDPTNSQNVTFTTPFALPAAGGTYNIEATVILAADANSINDSLVDVLNIIELPIYTGIAYAINAMNSSFNIINLTTGDLDSIAPFETYDFPTGMKFIDTAMYVIHISGALDIVYEDGLTFPLGTITGTTGGLHGICHDALTGITYVTAYDGISANSNLYTLNMGTLAATLVGTICPGIVISIDMDQAGNMYAVNISDDITYSVDIATGAGTALGAVGIDLNYGQDIAWDKASGTLYGCLYDYDGGSGSGLGGVFGTIDVTTGAFTNIATITDEVAAFAINSNIVGITESTPATFAIYPNPADAFVTISVKGTAVVTITDMTGRVVISKQISGMENVSTEGLSTGIYIVNCNQNGAVSTSKLIIK